MNFLPTLPLVVTPLMALGLLLLVGAVGGYIASRIAWLPSITGFMVVGFVIGPSVLGVLDEKTMQDARILIDIALALILYRLGLSIDLLYLKQRPWIIGAALVESALVFGVVAGVLVALDMALPVAMLIAAIFVSSSPAVLLHVAHEAKAAGNVTQSSESLVALNNVFSYLIFILVLPFMHSASEDSWATIIFQPVYRLAGSLFLGIVIAHFLHQAISRTAAAPQYCLAFVIGALMLSLGLARELKLSMLITPLVVGLVVKNLEHENLISEVKFGQPFELFFILLFVYAGAGLHVKELLNFAPTILLLVLARSCSKIFAVSTAAMLAGEKVRPAVSRGLLLIPMAGMAIGLVQTSAQLFPAYDATVAALILGAVAIFETIGPSVAFFAFRLCGEANRDNA